MCQACTLGRCNLLKRTGLTFFNPSANLKMNCKYRKCWRMAGVSNVRKAWWFQVSTQHFWIKHFMQVTCVLKACDPSFLAKGVTQVMSPGWFQFTSCEFWSRPKSLSSLGSRITRKGSSFIARFCGLMHCICIISLCRAVLTFLIGIIPFHCLKPKPRMGKLHFTHATTNLCTNYKWVVSPILGAVKFVGRRSFWHKTCSCNYLHQ